jgi:uncharacterized protein DUF1566/dockerin type I repeat protein
VRRRGAVTIVDGTAVTRTLFSASIWTRFALSFATVVNLAAPSLTRATICGDLNGDAVVNIGDALIAAQYDVGQRTCGQAPFSHPEACDVNGDGACNIGDALKMAQCDVGLISCAFTCGPFACSSTTTTTTTTSTTTTAPPTCRFPATGQTTCWDSSAKVTSCAGTGQDGEIQAGAPLSYTDNGDGTITDNNTGLVWEKQSRDGSVHDVGNAYTWDEAFSAHVAGLNTANFAGHQDWRLPNVKELQTIVDYGNANPAVSTAFNSGCTASCTPTTCSCTAAAFYWSSTSNVAGPSFAWGVHFFAGASEAGGNVKSSTALVRAVRGSAPCLPATGQTACWDSTGTVIPCAGTGQDADLREGAPFSFIDNGDGTITDNTTGLVWEKKSADGTIHNVDNTLTWAAAFSTHVAGLNSTNFAGHGDWRLPNVKELRSIVDYGTASPSVSTAFDTGCTAGCTVTSCSCTAASPHWCSTTLASSPVSAWFVDFIIGNVSADFKATFHSVRAVRGVP